MEDKVLFKETQRFRQWWLWVLMVILIGDMLWITFRPLIVGESAQSKEGFWVSLAGLLVILAVAMLLRMMRLDTIIKADGIYVRLSPIHRVYRQYLWSDLDKIYVRQYKPIWEYGGWGLRGFGKNRAFNISGNQGLQLVATDGQKLLVGTQRENEIRQVLEGLHQWKA